MGTKYKCYASGGHTYTAMTAEKTVEWGTTQVYLSWTSLNSMISQLDTKGYIDWGYGFSWVHIESFNHEIAKSK